MPFDMNRTWSQAIALVRSNFQLLAVIAGVFVLLPALVIYSAMPGVFTTMNFPADPKAVNAELAALFPKIAIYGFVVFVLQTVGYLTMIALMGGGRPTVAESILRGVKAVPTALGALIVLFIGYMIVGVLLGVVIGLLTALAIALVGSGGSAVVIGTVMVVLYVVLVVVIAYFLTRISPLMPVIVLEPQYNPFAALLRSWRLTAPRAWAILGFFALLFVAYVVITIIFMTLASAFGVVAGGASVFVMGVFAGVLAAAVTMLLSAILVSIHQQLSGASREALSDTFE